VCQHSVNAKTIDKIKEREFNVNLSREFNVHLSNIMWATYGIRGLTKGLATLPKVIRCLK